MATYSTLPPSSYSTLGSQGNLYQSASYGPYNSDVTSRPYQQPPSIGGTSSQQQPYSSMNQDDQYPSDYSQFPQTTTSMNYGTPNKYPPAYPPSQQQNPYTNNDIAPKYINNGQNGGSTTSTQKKTLDNQHDKRDDSLNEPPITRNQQINLVRSEHQIPNRDRSKSQPRHSPNNGAPNTSENSHSNFEMKPNKSSMMRAAANNVKLANKQKHEKIATRKIEVKVPQRSTRKGNNTENDMTDSEKVSTSKSNTERETTKDSKKRNDTQSRKSRKDDSYPTDHVESSMDEQDFDNPNQKRKNVTNGKGKRTTFNNEPHYSDSYLLKNGSLPPLRRKYPHDYPPYDRPPYRPPYDDYSYYRHPYDRSFPPAYGSFDYRGHHPYYPDYPPYLPYERDAYDPFFDYEKRSKPKRSKSKHQEEEDERHQHAHSNNNHSTHEKHEQDHDDTTAKSRDKSRDKSRKGEKDDTISRKSNRIISREEDEYRRQWEGHYDPYYGEHDMLELWRKERNDYLKKKFKPTIHDVLYSQQWMKSDSYLENQRRRAVRDAQGYYFPYRTYTLKDYKDLQKADHQNPFASLNETAIDRKQRAKKRIDYGTQIERSVVENPVRHRNNNKEDDTPRKPWHLSNGDINESEQSKRERALEYAKNRVVKSRKSQKHENDNGFFADGNDDVSRREEMEWDVLISLLIFQICNCSSTKYVKNSRACKAELRCGENSESMSVSVVGFRGVPGDPGQAGERGPPGIRGLPGPRGRDGYMEKPASFFATLPQLFFTKDVDGIMKPWDIPEFQNAPDVSNYFSQSTGIFTVPTDGVYQFFLTISVSRSKASVWIASNGEKIRTIWVEGVALHGNTTIGVGWASASIDCIIRCKAGDRIYTVAAYRSQENFNSYVYGYSYTTFSGVMLFPS
ncbi:unnamed protein product [Didymodactylos carnosus]|uniref:C1q domain-containing protein n=1 Tax=Didymodactylos carnosus TaxID=1234261 RepID=A0A813VJ13_9BILA|nr:unnamed protein product [Didymodactylos carnosus]CAF0910692.1 unnamed protein product [Didymodactylos carnosus]CAF3634033.1 unnamed protein product [Didymodactylos carnosus]CAF3689841.1 unnamed protein product [Didymodactylos carnosus]